MRFHCFFTDLSRLILTSLLSSLDSVRDAGVLDEIIDIPDVMFNGGRLRKRNFFDEILSSLSQQSIQQVDSAVTQGVSDLFVIQRPFPESWFQFTAYLQLSRFLFRGSNPFGLDLAAINIQRARDHGVRPYNDYLEVGGNKRIAKFEEFGPELGAKLAEAYHHPDDVDLWIGGLLESARNDGLVGPTFGDIIADQFSKLRRGDRYFYEHDPKINPGAFTIEQLKEVKKSSLARMLCDNSDNLQSASLKSFLRPDASG